ncbi:helix-turn-helix domain-containing protein [Streptomyces sp. ASQP_92]|uniref:helix-turn-helix domain-containing protein n=1 Tax=Streptomyces sp. ASQP_92 TaxID=2979116 RepID=UPI0021C09C40|nr:helix-turn-helix transcriptional regulator [Streptomyces sp. ASQP_92]MCT9094255.1 helix-turn-helix domain-containing protein [Streptomyces sp. ASQP_92]
MLPKDRVGWLLRVNRVYGRGGRWFRLTSFAEAFHGGSWPKPVDASRISRWENGGSPPTLAVLRRYEELLELPRNTLVSTVEMTMRYYGVDALGPTPRHGSTGNDQDADQELDRLEVLIDRVCSTALVSGSEWDETCRLLSAHPHLVLVPRSRWDALAERLLAETIISASNAWRQRFEAFNRLLGHPMARRAAIAACATLARDRSCQIFVEPICVLDTTAHPDATLHVLAQLDDPTNDRVLYGALLACFRKVRQRHLSEPDLVRLGNNVEQLLTEPALAEESQLLAAQLLRLLDPAEPVAGRLRLMLTTHPLLQRIVEDGRLASAATAAFSVRRIVDLVLASQTRELAGFEDHTLPLMVDQMLFHPSFDVRLYATAMLSVTPYRQNLAAAIAVELRRPAVLSSQALTHAFLGALRQLGGPAERPLVEWLVSGRASPWAAESAAGVIGHLDGASSELFWRTEIARYSTAWRRARSDGAARVLHGLIYALGITGQHALLAMIADDARYPATVRAAATWWLNIPEFITASAFQE